MNDAFELKIVEEEKKPKSAKTKVKYINGQTYEYEIFKLVDEYDPVLREVCEPFEFAKTGDQVYARYVAVSLIETMKEHNGVGLAANQVGLRHRVFVMGSEGVGYAFFNPVILETSGEEKFKEGCLSFPGLFLPIKRPASVKVRYQDMNGELKEQNFTGLSARVILHEYDHLDGLVFTDQVSRITLNHEKGKVKKNLKLLRKQQESEIKQELIRKAIERLVLDA